MAEAKLRTKERNNRDYFGYLKTLRPIDDDFMRCIFKDNITLVQHILQIITEKSDLKIVTVVTQADMKRLVGGRTICLDAYGTDDTGKLYDLEIQRESRGASVHRARYHVGVIDVENLNAGQQFHELPDVYVIFITEHDIFGEGKAFYPIERVNMVTGKLFHDGEHILYVNGAYRGDDEIGRLMHDFSCANPDEMYDEELAKVTRYYKNVQEGGIVMCQVMDEIREKGREEGREEGMERRGLEDIKNIMESLSLTIEQAMDALKIPAKERNIFYSRLC